MILLCWKLGIVIGCAYTFTFNSTLGVKLYFCMLFAEKMLRQHTEIFPKLNGVKIHSVQVDCLCNDYLTLSTYILYFG